MLHNILASLTPEWRDVALVAYWILALALSFFYGAFAYRIHEVQGQPSNKWSKAHQWWFNFVGSITGWASLFVLLVTPPKSDAGTAALLVIAVTGVTGNLPYFIRFGKAKPK